MARPSSSIPSKTTLELEPDVRTYLVQRAKEEGRTIKWLVNDAVRKQMLAEQALETQPELFRQEA
jgi:hypothetical protein